jgi:hypothetical protein
MLEVCVGDFLLNMVGSAAVASAFIAGIMAGQGSRMLAGTGSAPSNAVSDDSDHRITESRP